MRITIPTTGSRGDVQPYVALGVGLQARGHKVCLATHADFETFVRTHGLDFYPLADNGQELQASDTGDRMLRSGGNPFAFMREFTRLRKPLFSDLLYGCWQACRGADVILGTNTELFLAEAVAEKERLPLVWTSLQPAAPSRYLANFLFPTCPGWVPGSGLYNLATHILAGLGMGHLLGRAWNQARRDVLGLPPVPFGGPIRSFFIPSLLLDGFSTHVVPRPPDWGPRHCVAGYWFLDPAPDWRPPGDLSAFLAAGPPPVYVGFGSMHNRDADRVTELVVQALDRAGQRGVLLTGWGGLADFHGSDQIFPVASVPHAWLFPQTAAVVHHGGAGTTAAALRAGVPSLVVPFMSDQPYWGRRVHTLGAGPQPIPRRRLTVENLTDGFRRMMADQAMRNRAAELGRLLRAEDGVGRAVDLLEQVFQGKTRDIPRADGRAVVRSLLGRFASSPTGAAV